jgi:hypothetical protein
MKVADLFGLLGMKVNRGEFAKADAALASTERKTTDLQRAMLNVAAAARRAGEETSKAGRKSKASFEGVNKLLAAAGAFFGLRAGKAALIDFNANVEETKNKIAGMLALTKKTNLTDELTNADRLFANLQRRAASLPGTTQEYTNMLGQLVRPVTAAGLGMQDLEDITVNAVVAAKAFGVQWEVAARDVQQMLQGQVTAGENQLAQSLGISTAADRKRFNALSADRRAQEVRAKLTQPQITQLAAAQGQTFSGVTSTLKDAVQQFFGKVGIPLFKALTAAVRSLNGWIERSAESIAALATSIGGALATAFEVVSTVVGFFIDNADLAISLMVALTTVMVAFGIKSAIAWAIAAAPITLIVAAIAAVVFALLKVKQHAFAIKQAIVGAFRAIGSVFVSVAGSIKSFFVGVFDFIADKVQWLIDAAGAVRDAFASAVRSISIDDLSNAARAGSPQVPAARVPAAPAGRPGSTASSTTNTTNINVGDINVQSRSQNSKAVAQDSVNALKHALADRGVVVP